MGWKSTLARETSGLMLNFRCFGLELQHRMFAFPIMFMEKRLGTGKYLGEIEEKRDERVQIANCSTIKASYLCVFKFLITAKLTQHSVQLSLSTATSLYPIIAISTY